MNLYQKSGAGQQQLSITHRSAFTLIELLVVVLIIGILASIALPQYQRSVMRARATEALINVRAIHSAEQRHYLANGTYTEDLSLLDIEVPRGNDWVFHVSNNSLSRAVYANSDTPDFWFELPLTPGPMWCAAPQANKALTGICATFGPFDHSGPGTSGVMKDYYKLN